MQQAGNCPVLDNILLVGGNNRILVRSFALDAGADDRTISNGDGKRVPPHQ